MDIYLQRMLEDKERSSDYVGMNFENPLNISAIAQGMGVSGEKIEDPKELGPAVRRAFESGKPALIDVSIDGSL